MKAMGIVFSNIYDGALGELTNYRTVVSLPFGGRYRLIDFVLSNMSNSGIYQIGIITKYNYRSLMDHLGRADEWDLNRKNEGLVIIPPFATGNLGIYKGKLEALYSATSFIDNPKYDYVVLSDSTTICNIDIRPAIEQHIQSGAAVTVVSNTESDKSKVHPLILKTDDKGEISEILIDSKAEQNDLVGMGMFIFSRQMLVRAIEESHAKGLAHLERDFIQRGFNDKKIKVCAYKFEGVVLRNENIASYFANNMALLNSETRNGIFRKHHPIYTKVRDEIPTYYGEGNDVEDCIVADGCTINGKVKNSVLFRGAKIEVDTEIKNSIIMQGAKVHKSAKLDCVILDKNVTVTEGACLKGTPQHPVIVKKGETV